MSQNVAAPEMAERWVCDRCGVCIRQSDGKHTQLPENWAVSDDGQFCLICRRARAAEAALDSLPDDSTQDDRAKLRRSALLEFEVTRTPDRSNGEIARACRSSVPAVAQARQRLDLADPREN
ncbi:MAG: hypothetical protein ACRDKV_00090 [Solirubrobacterales bacterium]